MNYFEQVFFYHVRTKDWTQGENFVTVSLQKKNLFTFKEEEWERARSIPRLESFFFTPTPSWKQPPPPPTQSWNLPWGVLIIMSLPYGRNFFGGRSQAATVVGSDFTLLPFDNLGGLPAYFFLPPKDYLFFLLSLSCNFFLSFKILLFFTSLLFTYGRSAVNFNSSIDVRIR